MEQEMSYGSDYQYIPATSMASGVGFEVLPDLFGYTIQIVNICFVGYPKSEDFVLIDAGMPGSANEIIAQCEHRFGNNKKPKAIILTHGHFDHVGAIIELVKYWKVPVYAHPLEIPYLTGKAHYPEADPSVEGGVIAKLSTFFPNEPIDLGDHIFPLSEDGSVPYLPEFRWIHTAGHTPGHVSFFRQRDRALVAGDAFITVKQDSLYKVITQEQEVNGPPRYFTPDWQEAWKSVKKLAALQPDVAITGHGLPMSGEILTISLNKLAAEFDQIAIPDYGKYVSKLN